MNHLSILFFDTILYNTVLLIYMKHKLDTLRNLVPSVQFKKREKKTNKHRGVLILIK